ncbi:MAG: RNA methyltransferase [Deltaproteobacteria bacterium]|nr:RNA methyltransferase [Deltaproteobacteria bacterium]
MDKERTTLLDRLGPKGIIDCLEPTIKENRANRFKNALKSRITNIHVVVEKLYDPLNGNAVIRSAEAFGIHNVHFIVPSEDYDLSRKVTIGAERWIETHHHHSVNSAIDWLKSGNITSWGALPPEQHENKDDIVSGRIPSLDLYAAEVDFPLAIWIGNEKYGLTDEAVAAMDKAFYIPLYGLSRSLNLSVSTAIALQNLTMRYKSEFPDREDISYDEQVYLYARWLLLDTENPEALIRNILARQGKFI